MSDRQQCFDRFYSTAARGMSRSAIRELLKLTEQPGIISFAGGLPHPDTFPCEDLAGICCEVLARCPAIALQYGTTEGVSGLREQLVEFLAGHGLDVQREELIVSTASQQSLDLLGKILLDPGDLVVVERPSYLGALSAFRSYGARFLPIEMDGQGLLTSRLRQELEGLRRAGNPLPKFIYTVPDFQNPSGVTMSLERRLELLKIAADFDLLIVEDVPYRWLRYRGQEPPMLSALERASGSRKGEAAPRRVIGLFTFSKILSPGIRLGWIVADPQLIDRMVQAKQSIDLCTSAFTQTIVESYLARGLLAPRIQRNIEIYGPKLKVMLESLEEHLPRVPGLSWTTPEGGLFIWVELPEPLDTGEMFREAIGRKVAYVGGTSFYTDGGGKRAMRLNFSYPSEEEIHEGVRRLGGLIRDRVC